MKMQMKKTLFMVVFALLICINSRIYAKAETTEYEVWIAGEQVTSDNMSGNGWRFEPADASDSESVAKLYLDNANIAGANNSASGEDWGSCIHSNISLEIVSIGDNTVSLNVSGNESSNVAIVSEEKLYFSGDGSLVVDCNDFTVNNEEFFDMCLIKAYRICVKDNSCVKVKGSKVQTNSMYSSSYSFSCLSSTELKLYTGSQLLVEGYSINDHTGSTIINDTSVNNSETELYYQSTLSIKGGDMVGYVWTTGLRTGVLNLGWNAKYSACSGDVTGDMGISCGTQVEEELILGDNVKADFESGKIGATRYYGESSSYGLTSPVITVGDKSVITSKSNNVSYNSYGIGVRGKIITLGVDSVIKGYGNDGGIVLTEAPQNTYYVIGGASEDETNELSMAPLTDMQTESYGFVYNNRVAKYVHMGPRITIRLLANGGDCERASVLMANGVLVGTLPEPIWTGYIFEGWYTKLEGGERITPTTMITESINLYARWKVNPKFELKIIESGSCGDSATYTIDNVGTLVISGTGKLDRKVFQARKDIKKLYIGEGITYIYENEFQNCTNIVYLSLPDSMISIGNYAFANCYRILNDLVFSDKIKVIGGYAFYNCSEIEYVTIPLEIAIIHTNAFNYCRRLTIRCIKDSRTQRYALENNNKWENYWKLSFDANGGKVSQDIKYPTDNTSIGTLPTPSRANYEFMGWYTSKTGGTKVTSQTIITDNMTLYARWEAIKPNAMSGFTYSERTSNSVTLKWTKNGSATGYLVQQYKNGNWVTIKTITSNATVSYNATGLNASKTYQFKIIPYKTVDGIKVYGGAATKNVKTLPSYTKGFTYSGRTASLVTLKWTKNTSADGYVIQQYKNGKWTTIKTITKNSTVKYKVSGLKASVKYKFRIKAYKMDGNNKIYASSYATKSVKTLPSTVKSFTYKARTKTTITLKWAKNTSADGYVIQQYKGGKWTTIKTISKKSAVSYKVTGLKKGTTYKFRIRAYKKDGSKKLYSLSYTKKSIKTLKK